MTIEQKAKAYDEALKKAKDMLSYKEVRREDMEYLFPELKESNDERIKKRILLSLQKDIMATKNSGCNTKDLEECIAWLEKQGEHAKFRDSIQVDDKVTRNKDGVLVNLSQLKRVAKKDEKQGEQKPNIDFSDLRTWKYIVDAVWTEKEGIGQYLDSPFTEEVAKKLQKRFGNIEQKPAEWSDEDEDILNTIINHFKVDIECTDDDDIIKWLKSLKDRVQPQPKQEWSEEEIETCAREAEDNNCIILAKHIRQLKSLRPQNTWKPSDVQMGAIKDAIDYLGGNTIIVRKHLISLYDQLEKLREE